MASGQPKSTFVGQNELIDDGRKYKKKVVEQHLSDWTFSPNIGDKTKIIDLQMTQKFLKEKQQYVTEKQRDASADDVRER